VKSLECSSLQLQQARFLSSEESAVQKQEKKAKTLHNDVEEILLQIDESARRWLQVDYQHVQDAYEKIKKCGTVSSQNGLMLLRCYGSLMRKIRPEERTQMLNETWKLLKSLGMEFKITHYNAWLRVSCENKAPVSAAEFLTEIESQNIAPNRLTYQLLIDKYCEDGDIVGASKILEHMKDIDLPVTYVVFHALIKGHMHQGNPEGAKSILDSMRPYVMQKKKISYWLPMIILGVC